MSLQQVFQTPSPVALVTGSGSARVGRTVAEHLANLGCRVALHAHTSIHDAELAAKSIRTRFQTEAIVTNGSLADDATAERIVCQTHKTMGRIDILVNCAAIWSPKKLEEISGEDLRNYFQINAVGAFLCAKHAGLIMVDQSSGGCIVNIGDWATVRPYLDHAAYFPSKGAIETMTRSLAVEFSHRNRNVRVNCIQPGPVLLAEDMDVAQRERISASTLTGRIGTPQNIAHAVQFLCENDFINGVCLPVDGGRSIYAYDGLQVGLNTG